MNSGFDLRALLGDDISPRELGELERADALLRAAGPMSDIPPALTRRVAAAVDLVIEPARPKVRMRGRRAAAFAFAAAFCAALFALGSSTAGDEFDARQTIEMEPTQLAARASGVVRLGERDGRSGNFELELDVAGLPELADVSDYYVLELVKAGHAEICATFRVGAGTTNVRATVSYPITGSETWVVTLHEEHSDARPPALLRVRASDV